MTPSFNPDNWLDLAAYFLIGLPALVGAIGAYRWKRESQERAANTKSIAEATLYEVKNDHRSNLRDDIDHLGSRIDQLAELVKAGFAEVRRDAHQLREDMRTERFERLEGDRRKAG